MINGGYFNIHNPKIQEILEAEMPEFKKYPKYLSLKLSNKWTGNPIKVPEKLEI